MGERCRYGPNRMTDADELRIIAKDGGRLSLVDRQIIAGAADVIERLSDLLGKTTEELTETQQREFAIREQSLELAKRIVACEEALKKSQSWSPQPFCILSQPLSMSTGMVRIGIRDYPGKFTP